MSYYIDNQKFSSAIHEYVVRRKSAEANDLPIPMISNYIGECFMRIAEGMAKLNKFNRYTWKDEMISDGIESCLRYVSNYDIDTITRTSSPNAFYYFSKIVYHAFVRRIKKENRQIEIRQRYMNMNYDIEDFIVPDPQNNQVSDHASSSFIECAIQYQNYADQ